MKELNWKIIIIMVVVVLSIASYSLFSNTGKDQDTEKYDNCLEGCYRATLGNYSRFEECKEVVCSFYLE